MSRDNGRKYPRTIESKYSYLRIRAPEHLDVALEGLIRKVLKEQPKMDDIYSFAADYFDMLLKIREKAGIRKLTVQDICPHHNEQDANEMIKLASTFTKRKKEQKITPRKYRTLTLKQGDHKNEKIESKAVDGDVKITKNEERFGAVLPIVNEHLELEVTKTAEAVKKGKSEPDSEEIDLDLVRQPKFQDLTEKIIEAKEVIVEEDGDEDENLENPAENAVTTSEDMDEIRNKIKSAENDIMLLEKKEHATDENSVSETTSEEKAEPDDAETEETPVVKEESRVETEDTEPITENKETDKEVIDEDREKMNEVKAEDTAEEAAKEKTENILEEEQGVDQKDGVKIQETERAEHKTDISMEIVEEVDNLGKDVPKTMEEFHANSSDDAEKPGEQTAKVSEEEEEKIALEEAEEEKSDNNVSPEETKINESKSDIAEENTKEEETESELAEIETKEEKSQYEVAADERKEEKSEESETAALETNEGKSEESESKIEEFNEEKSESAVATEERNEENLENESKAEETKEEIPDIEIPGKEIAEEQNAEEETKTEETKEEKLENEIPNEETQKTTDQDQAEESEQKIKEFTDESSQNVPVEEIKTGESEMKIEEGTEDVNTTIEDGEKVESADNDETEESIGESEVAKIRSLDPERSKEAELMNGENPKSEKSKTKEFVDHEKEAGNVQNAEVNNEPTESVKTAAGDEAQIANDDAVVITSAENIDEKTSEDAAAPETSENEEGHTVGLKSVAHGAIAAVSGLGVAAAVFDQAKKELVPNEQEENTEKDDKTEDEKQHSEIPQETDFEEEKLTITQEVQKFLDRERQLSSYDKEEEKLNPEKEEENEKTATPVVEVFNKNVSGSMGRMTMSENVVKSDQPPENYQSGPSDVEGEEDEHDREASTTSGEIEFEISPLKQSKSKEDSEKDDSQKENTVPTNEEMDSQVDNVAEGNDGVKPEPAIILQLNSESEEKPSGDSFEESVLGEKTFLSVPESVIEEEYPTRKVIEVMQQSEIEPEGQSRSKRSIELSGEKSVNEEEAIIDCANVGNEIIQSGKVQKVELIEGDEDILQVHLTTTIETVQESGDSLLVQMTSKIDPMVEVSVETKVESPAVDDKMRLIRAAVVIQNGFRRFKKRKISGETLDISTDELDTSTASETRLDLSTQTVLKESSRENESSFSSSETKITKRDVSRQNLNRSATRTLLETHSLDPIRKITPLKTRSLSTVRYGVADFEVWNQLVKELEEAATKIQSKYRGYKTRKKLQRGNAIQSTATTSGDSSIAADPAEMGHRHTGEFHDSIVLPLPPK